jgi:hypothetical protein
MKRSAIAAGLAAALSVGSLAYADDVTIIERPDPDTTGSIVIRKPAPRVIVKEREPDVVIRERSNVVVRDNDPDVVIKEKRKDPRLIIKGGVSID